MRKEEIIINCLTTIYAHATKKGKTIRPKLSFNRLNEKE